MRDCPFPRRRGCYINLDGANSYGDALSRARPAIPPTLGGGATPPLAFPGVTKPSVDMQAVRDGRRSLLYYVDVDLSVARSVAAGTQLDLNIQGNFLYVDQRQNSGFATAHFQDENPVATPVTIFAGALWKVPFTRVGIENTAQAGASLRIIYGMDVDALPISAAGVTVLNPIIMQDQVDTACQILGLAGAPGIGTTVTALLNTNQNPNGFLLRAYEVSYAAGAGGTYSGALIAASVAPVGIGNQLNAIMLAFFSNSTTTAQLVHETTLQRRIPANWGLWVAEIVTVAAAGRSLFTSLEIK